MAEDRDKLSAEELEVWNKAIKELKATSFNQILLSSISMNDKLYMIFVNADANVLASIFFLYQKKSLEGSESHDIEKKEGGYSSSTFNIEKEN